MMDIARIGQGPVQGIAQPCSGRLAALPAPAARPHIAAAADSEPTRPEAGQGGSDTRPPQPPRPQAAAQAPPPPERARATLREDMLTGPPPTFEASLLELESDLRLAIARMQTARYREHLPEARRDSAAPDDVPGEVAGTPPGVPAGRSGPSRSSHLPAATGPVPPEAEARTNPAAAPGARMQPPPAGAARDGRR